MFELVKTRLALRNVLEAGALEAAEELNARACNSVRGTGPPPPGWPSSSLDLPDLRTIMHSLVDEYLIDIFRRVYGNGPFARLPIELIASVFSWVSTREQPKLGLVCRRWYNALYKFSHVWSHVAFDSKYGTAGALERILSISAGCPLYLDIRINERFHTAATTALSAHMHRFVTLRLSLKINLSTSGAATSVTEMLSTPAPQMKYFRLFDANGLFNHGREGSPVGLFGNNAPRLEVVKIQCRSSALAGSKETFRRVKHVLWSPVDGEGILRASLDQIIQICPELLQLGIDYETWAEKEDSGHTPLQSSPSLRTLVLRPNTKDADPEHLLRNFKVDSIPRIMIIHSVNAIEDLNDNLLRVLYAIPLVSPSTDSNISPGLFLARTMTIESPHVPRRSIRINMLQDEQDPFGLVPADWTMPYNMCQSPGVQRSLWDIGRHSVLAPQCFTHVRRLMIAEALFDPDVFGMPDIPELGELEQLTLYISLPAEPLESEPLFASGLVAAMLSTLPISQEPSILRCPKLKSIRFGVDEVLLHPRAVIVEPTMITGFIRRHIRYNPVRLDSIFLNSVHLYVLKPVELEEMYLLAKETVHDERRITAKFRRPEVMYWG